MQKTAYFFISMFGIIALLIYGKSVMIPFVLGMLLWYIARGTEQLLERIPFVKNYFPAWLKGLIAAFSIIGVLAVFFDIIAENINSLMLSLPRYEANIEQVIQDINQQFNINLQKTIQAQSGAIEFGNLFRNVFASLSDLISNTFMIIIYASFIILEQSSFNKKLEKVFKDSNRSEEFFRTLTKIDNSIGEYFKLKALVSLLTGFLSFIALWMIGVDAPAFWAFLIFILNFIPTIGSLIATLFPTVFSLLQFGEVTPALLVLGLVGVIQIIVGNVIEPRLMGSTMNISPLVTILALSLWGLLWGIPGMILSVPITVVMILVFSQFEGTKRIAILLSEKGEIET